MTLAATCDVALMLIEERLVRDVHVAQQVAAVGLAAGADIAMPDVDEELERLHQWLASAPEPDALDPGQKALRRALGLPGQ